MPIQPDWSLGAEGRIRHFQTIANMGAGQDDKKGSFAPVDHGPNGPAVKHEKSGRAGVFVRQSTGLMVRSTHPTKDFSKPERKNRVLKR
jgi:hypothetical protein